MSIDSQATEYARLAEYYFNRGDTRGDLYMATFFANKAIALGKTTEKLYAMIAISLFRKGLYKESVAIFAAYVTDESPKDTKYLYDLAKQYAQTGTATHRNKKISTKIKLSTENTSALSQKAGISDTAQDFYWSQQNIPCQAACPAGTNIPGYLNEVLQGNFHAAYKINLRDNIFPGILGRVCARPCESECRHGWDGLGEPVAICFSKRSAAQLQTNNKPVLLDKLYADSGKRVAIIGAGPAGLAAARELTLLGHKVVVFEKHHTPGGMMEQGIPKFRLPRDVMELEISQIELLGVVIRCNISIGKDISIAELLNDFNAVILAAGTLRPNMLDMENNNMDGIMHGLDYLLETNHDETIHAAKQVVVIGGGFTAMDCARTAKRLGGKFTHFMSLFKSNDWMHVPVTRSHADVEVIYRRSENEMLVTPGELGELEHEGIPMHFLSSPQRYVGKDGHITGIEFSHNKLGPKDTSGRRSPVAIEGSEYIEKADLILLATGQFPDTSWIDPELRDLLVAADHWPKAHGKHATDHPKIFLAGDYSTGAKSLIEAIAHAKEAALQVDQFLMGSQRMKKVVQISDSPGGSGRYRSMDAVPLQVMPELQTQDRDFIAEVETGYAAEQAVDEAQRCYQCNYKYEIDPDKCIYCNWCIKAKPQENCIVEISSLKHSAIGEVIGFERATSSEDTKQIYINQADCIRCNACLDACPVDAISVQKVEIINVKNDAL
ncbi:MAG: hypothetical protein COC15_01145 [Legionellales bacterium]|nr:MAG: hypothetical protein COC15_01145 [Legionellales bacterium]